MIALINDIKEIKIVSNDKIDSVSLKGFELKLSKQNESIYYYKTNKEIQLNKDIFININENSTRLLIGEVTLTEEFEKRYRYDGNLGYIYNKEKTEFKLFTPVAKEVILVVDNVEY